MSAAELVATSDEILISGDGHVGEPVDLWETRLPQRYHDQAPRFPDVRYGEGNHARVGGREPSERLKDMAIDGVSAEVLYPTLGNIVYRVPDIDLAEACCHAYNEWMAEYCAAAPDRLWGQAIIPLWNVEQGVSELEWSKRAGLAGATIWLIPPDDLPFQTKHYEAFWAAAQDLEMPVSMHINAGFGHYATREKLTPFTRQIKSINMDKLAGMNALTGIICSGVLERHPRLKIVVAEIQVGWIPFWLHESDDRYERAPIEELDMPPSEYFWRQVYATFIDDRVGTFLLQKWGQDNFLWSSDYPHTNGLWPTSRQIIARSMPDLPDATRRNVVCNNTARLYNKPIPSPIGPPEGAVGLDAWSPRARLQR